MKQFKTIDKIKIAFFTSLACIFIFMLITYANMRKAAAESRNVNIALTTLHNLENLYAKVQTIETGQRGFTISGDEIFLSGYNLAIRDIGMDIDNLNNLKAGNGESIKELSDLIVLINEKVKHSKLIVETRRIDGYEASAALVAKGYGKQLMDKIVASVNNIETNDRALLRQSNAGRESYAGRITYVVFFLSVFFLAIIITGYFLVRKDLKKAELFNTRLQYNATLLKNISDPIITTDTNGLIGNWNIHAQQLYGFSAEEAKGKNINILLGNTDNGIRAAGQLNNETQTTELRHFHKNGSDISAEVKTSVLKDGQGTVIGTISVIRDITQRKKMEQQLQQFSENLQQQVRGKAAELNHVFERVTDAFIALDNNWLYTHVNNIAAHMHGKSPEDLIGKKIWDVFPEVVGEPFYHALHAAADSGEAQRLELYYSKEDRWYEDLIYPGPDGISVYYHDITERKKAAEKLRVSEEDLKLSNNRFELVAKATNDAVWDWDMKTDVLWGNSAFQNIIGQKEGEVLHFEDFLNNVHPDDKTALLHNFKETLIKKGSILTEEFRFTDKKGKERVMYDRAYIIYNDEGRAYRMLGAMQDISADKEAEKKLVLEKELSDSIINSLPGIFYLYNKEGEFYRWNKNFEKVSGYSSEEMKHIHPLDLFADDEKELLVKKISNVFVSGEDNVEANFLTKSGKLIPYYFTGMVIQYEGETCLMGVGIDVSDKVRSQQELKESEEKFRTVVEQASDGIVIIEPDGRYVDVNASAEMLTGYSRSELLSMTVADLFDPEDVAETPFKFEEMQNGLPVLVERVIIKKNGKKANVEISANMLEDGRFQGIMRDITERKKTEEALKASEHKYRILFDQNPLPMWIIAYPSRHFLDVNEAAISSYGYSREEFMKMTVEDLHPERELFSLKYELKKVKEGIRNFGTRTHIKKNAAEIKVNVISHEIMYEDKRAILALANDVTEKFEAEENLQRSHEAMRELASHLETIREAERTHMAREIHDELGQQLTGLKMDISWLNRRIKSEDKAVEQKMKDTIELIDKTVITVRRIATQLRPSILDDLGLVAAMEWQSDEFEKRSEIKANFKSNTANISVPPGVATGIFRIFQESLTNVLRHSKATMVETFLSADNDTLVLNIKDNGIGFKEEDISNKKTLGLLGMKERVLLIKGTYEINGNTGSGTSVIITVPLKQL